MKSIDKIITTSFVFLSFTLAIHAQETVPVSKADILTKVAENNNAIKISEQEFNAARADYRQTNAIFLPNISASHTGITTTNPLMAFGSKLNQEILTQNDFNPALLNDPTQVQNFATKFEFQQPLVNLDGIYQRKAAKSTMEAMALKSERLSDYLNFEVEKAYMQLQLAYKGVAVLEKALKTVNDHKKIADNSFKQGYLQRADVLNVEVRVTEVQNQLQSAQSNVKNASDYLAFLMDDKSGVVFMPTDSLSTLTTEINADKLSENRADIQAMQLATNAYQAMNKADKMAFLPRLNAFGSYELYDDKLFNTDANGYLIGAQLQWNLFQGSKRIGKTQKSKAEFEKAKLEYEQYVSQSELDLNKARRMFLDAENKLKLKRK